MDFVKKILGWLPKKKPARPTRPPACPFCHGTGEVFTICTCDSCRKAAALGYKPMPAKGICPACCGTRVVPACVVAQCGCGETLAALARYMRAAGGN